MRLVYSIVSSHGFCVHSISTNPWLCPGKCPSFTWILLNPLTNEVSVWRKESAKSVQWESALQIPVGATHNMAELELREVQRVFGIDNFTHIQSQTLKYLLEGKDVFLSILTDGGKSMTYQAFPFLAKPSNPCHCQVLIISPLLSIMKEQVCFYSLNSNLINVL